MGLWVIRYRYMYLPIQQTGIEAETADEAWEKLITKYAEPRDNYNKIEIYKAD